MAFMFEKLEVYRKAVDFTDEACALAESFPRGYRFLADQLNRAALASLVPTTYNAATQLERFKLMGEASRLRNDTGVGRYRLCMASPEPPPEPPTRAEVVMAMAGR